MDAGCSEACSNKCRVSNKRRSDRSALDAGGGGYYLHCYCYRAPRRHCYCYFFRNSLTLVLIAVLHNYFVNYILYDNFGSTY